MNRGVNNSAEKVHALLRQHSEGRTIPEIARETGLSLNGVRTVLDGLSLEYPVSNEGTNYFLVDFGRM